MKLAVAGDSAGVNLAQQIADYLKERDDLDVSEVSNPPNGGTEFYAELSDRVCSGITNGTYDRAILVCGTGIGVLIAVLGGAWRLTDSRHRLRLDRLSAPSR